MQPAGFQFELSWKYPHRASGRCFPRLGHAYVVTVFQHDRREGTEVIYLDLLLSYNHSGVINFARLFIIYIRTTSVQRVYGSVRRYARTVHMVSSESACIYIVWFFSEPFFRRLKFGQAQHSAVSPLHASNPVTITLRTIVLFGGNGSNR